MIEWFRQLGHTALSAFERLGRASLLFLYILGGIPSVLPRL